MSKLCFPVVCERERERERKKGGAKERELVRERKKEKSIECARECKVCGYECEAGMIRMRGENLIVKMGVHEKEGSADRLRGFENHQNSFCFLASRDGSQPHKRYQSICRRVSIGLQKITRR